MTTRGWEAKCRRCGRCCYEKIEFEGEVYYTNVPCEHLDPETRLCRVYARRHKVRSGCVPLSPRMLGRGWLPADCPYVEDIAGYIAPHLWDEESS